MQKFIAKFIENFIINTIFWSFTTLIFYFLKKDRLLHLFIFVLLISFFHAILETLIIIFREKDINTLESVVLIIISLISLFFCALAIVYINIFIRVKEYLNIGLAVILGIIFYK